MPACLYVPTTGETVSTLIDFFDCQARTIGAAGFQTLAAEGSTASLLLTAFLTIAVAIFGFRLLLDETPSVRDLVLTLAKVGVVLALATSWPAYRTLVYDVAIKGPRQLASEVSGTLALPGSDGSLNRRLDNVDREFDTLDALGSGPYVVETTSVGLDALANTGLDRMGVSLSRTAFLVTTIGAFALLSLSGGLLLALGPLFVLFLLFTATRGLAEGWLRALISILLATVMTIITLSVELAVLEPWMADLIGRRAGGEPVLSATTPLLATATAFGIVLIAILLLSLRIGFSLRIPAYAQARSALGSQSKAPPVVQPANLQGTRIAAHTVRSRAALIADSIAATQRREEHLHQASSIAYPQHVGGATRPGSGPDRLSSAVPLGQSFRRTARRVSSSAQMRDRRS